MLTHGTENMVSFGNPQSVGGDLIMTEQGVQLTLRDSPSTPFQKFWWLSEQISWLWGIKKRVVRQADRLNYTELPETLFCFGHWIFLIRRETKAIAVEFGWIAGKNAPTRHETWRGGNSGTASDFGVQSLSAGKYGWFSILGSRSQLLLTNMIKYVYT